MPKVNKQKIKSQVKKDIHPNSRKARQLHRTSERREKLEKQKDTRDALLAAQCTKLDWFLAEVDPSKNFLTMEESLELVSRYLGRFDEELKEIEAVNKIPRRHGTAKASRVDAIAMIKAHEADLFFSGRFEGPDLSSAALLDKLRQWDGSWKTLTHIKMRTYRQPPAVKSD